MNTKIRNISIEWENSDRPACVGQLLLRVTTTLPPEGDRGRRGEIVADFGIGQGFNGAGGNPAHCYFVANAVDQIVVLFAREADDFLPGFRRTLESCD
jgi:hypothetical protein